MAAGITADLSLGSYWFIHLEGQLAWGVFSAADQARTLLAPTALLGFGVQL